MARQVEGCELSVRWTRGKGERIARARMALVNAELYPSDPDALEGGSREMVEANLVGHLGELHVADLEAVRMLVVGLAKMPPDESVFRAARAHEAAMDALFPPDEEKFNTMPPSDPRYTAHLEHCKELNAAQLAAYAAPEGAPSSHSEVCDG